MPRISHACLGRTTPFCCTSYVGTVVADPPCPLVLDPALRSRGNTRQAATALLADAAFVHTVEGLLQSPPTGRYWPPRLGDLAERVARLEARVAALEVAPGS